MSYLVNKNGEQFGPYGLDELSGYVSRGSFLLSDQCWQDGWDSWRPLSTIISRPPPPPPPPSQQSAIYIPAQYHQGNIQTSSKSRVAYVLLGIFLGGFGIHNFFAGYSGKGISQLLIVIFTGWLIIPLIAVGIWVIIEVCTVNKDANGVPFS